MNAKRRFPNLVYNPISMIGAVIAIVNFVVIVGIILYEAVVGGMAPYAGIVAFIMLPVALIIGLILIPVGMIFERRRLMRVAAGQQPRSFYIDLGKPSHRLATMIFASGTIVFLLITAVGSYKAYEFTESVTFCGQVCHSVMEPEFIAYQFSPHARVTCAECHVGSGADWYVRSKLSGAYQVYAATFNLYPKPPDKFHGSKDRLFDHYMVDEENTSWPIRMLIKTGGGSQEAGIAEGIHWHMNIANEVDYIATDDKRQEIAWVRIKDFEGNVREYMNEENPIEPGDFSNYEMRRMDCIDCHNRPTHVYRTPSKAVNKALSVGEIDRSLPDAKKIAIEALIGDYTTKDSALTEIDTQITAAYAEQYPEILETKKQAVEQMVAGVQEIYYRNFFPEMRVKWDVYPDNIGHFSSPGCYRCHNGSFSTEDGQTISNDCSTCHIIISQGAGANGNLISPGGLEFKHPVDIEEAWKEMACSDCHTGTSQL